MSLFRPYLEEACGDNEYVIRSGRIAWPYRVLSWLALFLLGPLLIGFYIFIRMQVWISTTEFGLTNRKIVWKKGLFSVTTHEIPMTSLDEVEVYQNFWGRLFGYGRLRLWGSGRGELRSPPINNPVELRAAISDVRARILQPKDSQPLKLNDQIASLGEGVPQRPRPNRPAKNGGMTRRRKALSITEVN